MHCQTPGQVLFIRSYRLDFRWSIISLDQTLAVYETGRHVLGARWCFLPSQEDLRHHSHLIYVGLQIPR